MHPSMPQEPLVILHCALQQGAASSMNDILHPHQLQLAHPDAVGEPHRLLHTAAPSAAKHYKHCTSAAWCLSNTIRFQAQDVYAYGTKQPSHHVPSDTCVVLLSLLS